LEKSVGSSSNWIAVSGFDRIIEAITMLY
jgi:hypothetical protein